MAPETQSRHAPERLLMLTDGVFAISMTLLVLDVRIPEDVPVTAAGFAGALPELSARLGIFVGAFMITSRFWIVSHRELATLRHVDNGVIERSILFLAGITCLPVATGVLFRFVEVRGAITFAACILAVTAALAARLWWYLSSPRRDLADIDPDERRRTMLRSLLVVVIYLLPIPVAWLLPEERAGAALFVWLLMAVVDRVAGRLNRILRRA